MGLVWVVIAGRESACDVGALSGMAGGGGPGGPGGESVVVLGGVVGMAGWMIWRTS